MKRPDEKSVEGCFQEWLDLFRRDAAPPKDEFLAGVPEPVREEVARIIEAYEELRAELGSGPAEPKSGRTIGEFRLVRILGRGGIGIVWEAEQRSLSRRVALKLLSPVHTLSERNVERFRQEALAGARLTHPGIVSVHSVGEADGQHYLVQELIPGGRTLADQIAEQRNALDVTADDYRRLAGFFATVADALEHAHAQGVVHRDVKPSNVLIGSDGRPKVADFGLARIDEGLGLSLSGDLIGTPFYMSPEQTASSAVGPLTDVFSLGATLYEALTFRRAFDGDTTQQVFAQILYTDPPDPRLLRSRVPRDLAVICLRALEKNAAERYPTMDALAADLRRFANHEPIIATPPGVASRVVKWTRRHPIASTSGAVAALALTVIALLIAQVFRESGEKIRAQARSIEKSYVANIAPVPLTLETGDFQFARWLLDACDEQLRGWEWAHLSLYPARSPLAFAELRSRVSSVAYRPDAAHLASGWYDEPVRVFDAADGAPVGVIEGDWAAVRAVQYSPDGQTLAAGTYHAQRNPPAGILRLFDADTFEERAALASRLKMIKALAFSEDGSHVAAGGTHGVVVWEVAGEEAVFDSGPDAGDVVSVGVGPRGQFVAAVASDGTGWRWDVTKGESAGELASEAALRSVAVCGTTGRIVAGADDGTVRIWSGGADAPSAVFVAHGAAVQSLALAADGSTLVSGAADGSVVAWTLPTDEREGGGPTDRTVLWREKNVECLAVRSDGQRVVAGFPGGHVRLLDATWSEPVTALRAGTQAHQALALNERFVAVGAADGRISIFDAQTGALVRAIDTADWVVAHTDGAKEDGRVLALDFTPDGHLVSDVDGSLAVWAVDSGDLREERSLPWKAVGSLAVSPDGESVLAGRRDGVITAWDRTTGETAELAFHTVDVTAIAFAPDGALVASSSRDGVVCLFEPGTGRVVHERPPREGEYVGALAFSSDGDRLVYGSGRSAYVRRLSSEEDELALHGHEGLVTGVAFSPDGRRVFTASYDGTVRVWDAISGSQLVALRSPEGAIYGIALSAGGRRLVTAGANGVTRVWESELDQLRKVWASRHPGPSKD